jgi:hypothetical protein
VAHPDSERGDKGATPGMTSERPMIVVGGYRLIYEDIDARPTNGIPSAETFEVQAFLNEAHPSGRFHFSGGGASQARTTRPLVKS